MNVFYRDRVGTDQGLPGLGIGTELGLPGIETNHFIFKDLRVY